MKFDENEFILVIQNIIFVDEVILEIKGKCDFFINNFDFEFMIVLILKLME